MKTIILLALFITSISFADDCSSTKFLRTQQVTVAEIKEETCFKKSDQQYYSRGFNFKEIPSLEKSDVKVDPSMGNPVFQYCRRIGGKAELVKVQRKGVWIEGDRCVFATGKGFVSGDLLMELIYPDS